MAYTNSALIEERLGRDLTVKEQAYLMSLIPAIKIWIDKKLGSTFDVAHATTRHFDGGRRSISIDPCTGIESVQHIDSDGNEVTLYEANQYIAEPINETVKRELRARWGSLSNWGGRGYWPSGRANIAVTAKFTEWNEGVPDDIRQVATAIAANALVGGSSDAANVQSESLEGHSITYRDPTTVVNEIGSGDPLVKSILELRDEPLVE